MLNYDSLLTPTPRQHVAQVVDCPPRGVHHDLRFVTLATEALLCKEAALEVASGLEYYTFSNDETFSGLAGVLIDQVQSALSSSSTQPGFIIGSPFIASSHWRALGKDAKLVGHSATPSIPFRPLDRTAVAEVAGEKVPIIPHVFHGWNDGYSKEIVHRMRARDVRHRNRLTENLHSSNWSVYVDKRLANGLTQEETDFVPPLGDYLDPTAKIFDAPLFFFGRVERIRGVDYIDQRIVHIDPISGKLICISGWSGYLEMWKILYPDEAEILTEAANRAWQRSP